MGNYWLWDHLPKNHDWITAERDAPWRRYTHLNINIAENYARARIDWWFVEYRKIHPQLAWTLVIGLPLLSVAFLLLFFFEVRRAVLGLRRLEQLPAAQAAPTPPQLPEDGVALSAST